MPQQQRRQDGRFSPLPLAFLLLIFASIVPVGPVHGGWAFEAKAVTSRSDILGVMVTMIEGVSHSTVNGDSRKAAASTVRSIVSTRSKGGGGNSSVGLELYGCMVGNTTRLRALHVDQQNIQCEQPHASRRAALVGLPVTVVAGNTVSTAAPGAVYALPEPDWPARSDGSPAFHLCACLMMWQRTKFLDEWAAFHRPTGIEAVFLCDNESEDNLRQAAAWLNRTLHVEYKYLPGDHMHQACIAHCALAARDKCSWMAFTDVDEFLVVHDSSLSALTARQAANVGSITLPSLHFLPSGHALKTPWGGVVKNYVCRRKDVEPMPKSVTRLRSLHPTFASHIHFQLLRPGAATYHARPEEAAIFHYKTQAWEEFQLKRIRRAGLFSKSRYDMDAQPEPWFLEAAVSCWPQPDGRSVNDTRLRDLVWVTQTNKRSKAPPNTTLIVSTGGGRALERLRALLPASGLADAEWATLALDNKTRFSVLASGHRPRHPVRRYQRVVHLLQHPLPAISAIIQSYGGPEWDFVARHTPQVRLSDPVTQRALHHWVTWNQRAERAADAWLFYENATLEVLCQHVHDASPGCSGGPRARAQRLADAESDPPAVSWQDLHRADSFMASEARHMAQRYGYAVS